jgi:glycosyltransferase involved in cell wall biosynthesis
MKPELTFIVPAYNYGRYLMHCVDSILGQRGAPDFEVLIVDDASTDDTSSLIDAVGDPRVVAIRHASNQGHARTINEALRLARGRFIARIDPDDRYRPDFAALAFETLVRHPSVGLVYADVALIDEAGSVTQVRTYPRPTRGDFEGYEFIRLLEENFICAATVMASREAWLACGEVPSWLAFNDWYFNLQIARRYPLYYIDEVVAEYRVHDANLHLRIIRDRSEERSVFWLLDHVFAETEDDADMERQKHRARRRVYARHHLLLADKYFGLGMSQDARRCYVKALFWDPLVSLRPGQLRRLGATLLGQERYRAVKDLLRSRGR